MRSVTQGDVIRADAKDIPRIFQVGVALPVSRHNFYCLASIIRGSSVAKWLARWTPDRQVRVQALAGSLCCVLGQDTLLS